MAVEANDDQARFLQPVLASIVGAMLHGIAVMCAVVLDNDARLHVQQIWSTERCTGAGVLSTASQLVPRVRSRDVSRTGGTSCLMLRREHGLSLRQTRETITELARTLLRP